MQRERKAGDKTDRAEWEKPALKNEEENQTYLVP